MKSTATVTHIYKYLHSLFFVHLQARNHIHVNGRIVNGDLHAQMN